MSTDKQLVELIETGIGMLAEIRQFIMEHNVGTANPENGVLTEGQIAERLQLSLSSIRKERKKGRYPFFFREGGRWITTPVLYGKWLQTHEKRAGFAVGVKRA